MLSNTSKYAIRAVIYLAVNSKKDTKIGIKKIAEDLEIPTPFLGKILQSLAKHKLLSSTKGPNGGFGLGKKPENITLFDIVEIIDGKDIFTTCLLCTRSCKDENKYCTLHEKYAQIRNDFTELFRSQTLTQIINDIDGEGAKIIL